MPLKTIIFFRHVNDYICERVGIPVKIDLLWTITNK